MALAAGSGTWQLEVHLVPSDLLQACRNAILTSKGAAWWRLLRTAARANDAARRKSRLAYSGRCRIDARLYRPFFGRRVEGTEQRRHFRVEADKLFIQPCLRLFSPRSVKFFI